VNISTQSLHDLEQVIERGMTTFVDVGRALYEIKQSGLYRDAGYNDFDGYCRDRWGWERTYAYRLIDAAEVAAALLPIGNTPKNEAQARELARLKEPVAIQEAWAEVRERHGDAPTAADIRQVVNERLNPAPAAIFETYRDDPIHTPHASELAEHEALDALQFQEYRHAERDRRPVVADLRNQVKDTIERARTEAAVALVLSEDSDDVEDQRARLRVQFSRGLKNAAELRVLKPEAIGALADSTMREDIARNFPLFRRWMDEVEAALPRGLRVVS
jgi:hypothetical protein